MKIRFYVFMMTGLLVISQAVRAQEKRPNIVLIMADDMGYSDIGCYGGEINTPNLDQMASDGLRFRQFYNNARCCPSRASLMTGLYPHKAGIGHMTNDPEGRTAYDYGLPSYAGDLNFQSVTIAEVLKSAGYQTLMTGKWHLGYHDRNRWPLQRGFDKYYGILAGASNFFEPSGKRGLTLMNDPIEPEGADFYITDAFTDYAIRFMNESQAESDAPFFLYLAYTSPHWPLNALEADIAKYRGTYKAGWKKLRRERFERMQRMGVVDGQVTQLSDDDGAEWDKLTPDQQDEMDYRMAIYAAQVDRMDQNIGRIIETLKASGELENTLIFFLTDNGACAEGGLLGGGEKELLGGQGGYFLTYGQSWANASATPFRTYKHWVHEGGIGTPLIVHWPRGVAKELRGRFTDQYGFLQDIMATAVEVANADYPAQFNGHSISPLQGRSMLHVLQGKDTPVHDTPIFWEHEGNGAVRYGDFKLVKAYEPGNPLNWELYDMSKDRAEMNDLSGKLPDVVDELAGYYEKWRTENGVLPYEEVLQIRKEKNAKR